MFVTAYQKLIETWIPNNNWFFQYFLLVWPNIDITTEKYFFGIFLKMKWEWWFTVVDVVYTWNCVF